MVEKIDLTMEGDGVESAKTDRKNEFRVKMESESGGIISVGGSFFFVFLCIFFF